MAEWYVMYFVTIFIYWIVTILLQIINSYMSLIMDRWMDVYILGNFFYTKLSISGYQGVHSWTGAVEFFHKRVIMFPILYKITCGRLLWKWQLYNIFTWPIVKQHQKVHGHYQRISTIKRRLNTTLPYRVGTRKFSKYHSRTI